MAANYQLYTQLKAAWVASHPDASSAEYDAAMRVIAKKCGV